MPSTKQQPSDDRDEQKREKWREDYLDAVDLRPAHDKQLEENDSQDSNLSSQ